MPSARMEPASLRHLGGVSWPHVAVIGFRFYRGTSNERPRIHRAESRRSAGAYGAALVAGGSVHPSCGAHRHPARHSHHAPPGAEQADPGRRQHHPDHPQSRPVRIPSARPLDRRPRGRLAILALTLYALLPLIRNTCTGISGVDRAVVEAGRGMGMTDRQLLLRVELPLALSVIIAGIRVAAVISVGLATIAAAIGAGGLGEYIFRGLAMVNNQVILAGAIPAALLAILADQALGWLERRLTR